MCSWAIDQLLISDIDSSVHGTFNRLINSCKPFSYKYFVMATSAIRFWAELKYRLDACYFVKKMHLRYFLFEEQEMTLCGDKIKIHITP